jgi:hypothetical protein
MSRRQPWTVLGPLALASAIHAQQPQAPCDGCKVCVVEPKKNTITVYNSMWKEYCQPQCSLWGMIRGWCGGYSGCGDCGPVRTKYVLIKKTVPACDTQRCVTKEVETCPPKAP